MSDLCLGTVYLTSVFRSPHRRNPPVLFGRGHSRTWDRPQDGIQDHQITDVGPYYNLSLGRKRYPVGIPKSIQWNGESESGEYTLYFLSCHGCTHNISPELLHYTTRVPFTSFPRQIITKRGEQAYTGQSFPNRPTVVWDLETETCERDLLSLRLRLEWVKSRWNWHSGHDRYRSSRSRYKRRDRRLDESMR